MLFFCVVFKWGIIVIFLSDVFFYEVLIVKKMCYLVVGWFSVNMFINDNIDLFEWGFIGIFVLINVNIVKLGWKYNRKYN